MIGAAGPDLASGLLSPNGSSTRGALRTDAAAGYYSRAGRSTHKRPTAKQSDGLVRDSRWWFSSVFSDSRRRWSTVRIGGVIGLFWLSLSKPWTQSFSPPAEVPVAAVCG